MPRPSSRRVNLTTLLVMTITFMTVMQMFPATSYIKMIDIFLIFAHLYPFSEVVLLTIMEYQREGDGSGEGEPTTASEKGFPGTGSDAQTPATQVGAGKRTEDNIYWYRFTGDNMIKYRLNFNNIHLLQRKKFFRVFSWLYFWDISS